MTKVMFGVAAALVLATSAAWAEDASSGEEAATATVASTESTSRSEDEDVSERAAAPVIEAGRESATMKESNEVRASFEERWLREREGYRDGGY